MALAALSGSSIGELRKAIAAGDAKRFQVVPGIGRKTAERVIVELREAIAGELAERAARRAGRADSPRALARDGLVGLGYDPAEAEAMLAAAARGGRRRRRARGADPGRAARGREGRVSRARAGGRQHPGPGRRGRARRSSTARCARSALDDFVGQEQLKGQLALFIEAARRRGEPLDHVLLAGPPGLGKTSLAHITARELDVPLVQTAGPALERKGDVAAFLTALEPGSVFFIDEIHRLARAVEETLYPAMEDRRLPIVLGQGAGARTVTLDLPPFTLVGATTRTGLLTTPLRERFGVVAPARALPARGAGPDRRALGRDPRRARSTSAGAQAIAARARGTPRVANRLLKRVRDFAEVRSQRRDHRGRGRPTRSSCSRSTRPASSASTGSSCARSSRSSRAGRSGSRRSRSRWARSRTRSRTSTSPICCNAGLIKRTPRGRVATARAYEHLGLEPPGTAAAACSRPLRRPVRLPSNAADAGAQHSRPDAEVDLIRGACPSSSAPIAEPGSSAERTAGFSTSPGAARNAGSAFCSSCSTTTTRTRMPRSSSATASPRDRLRARKLRADRPEGRVDRRPPGEGRAGPAVRRWRRPDRHVARMGRPGARAPVRVEAEGDLPAEATADVFPAYDEDGGLLLVLTPKR